MSSSRCAACKYLRRKCKKDCVLAPHFPSTNPQRFAVVHKIFGASNITKFLQELPVELRGEAAESMTYEAYKRIEDPVYGCVGIISQLQQLIFESEFQLFQIKAEIAFRNANPHHLSPFVTK